jgi:D-alanyl-D-alanine-carboxypeptidase/D-alanyl-D-alanine-endopeptidase
MRGTIVTEMDFGRRSRTLWCFCILLTSLGIASCAQAQPKPASQAPTEDWSIPSDDELRAFLATRMEHNGVGIVIGVIEPAGRRVVAYGRSGTERPLDGDSIFLLGSVSKSFVDLVLADMSRRGEVQLDGVKMPQRGRPITLADLSTHTSGLPAWPSNINMLAGPDPMEAYTVHDLYRFLSTYTPSREPGGGPKYSNLDVWLLGRLLGLRQGVQGAPQRARFAAAGYG